MLWNGAALVASICQYYCPAVDAGYSASGYVGETVAYVMDF
jgi:hypothetical protein